MIQLWKVFPSKQLSSREGRKVLKQDFIYKAEEILLSEIDQTFPLFTIFCAEKWIRTQLFNKIV